MFVYFIASDDINVKKHPAFTKWCESMQAKRKLGDGTEVYTPDGYIFPDGYMVPDSNEERIGMACETIMRKIDNSGMVIVVPSSDGFHPDVIWQIAYALHAGCTNVYASDMDGNLDPIYDISLLVNKPADKEAEE